MGRKRPREESSKEAGISKKKHKKSKHSHKSKSSREMKPITLKIKLGDKYISTTGSGNSLTDDVSSVAESEPLSLADQSLAGSENWEGSDISVGKDDFDELVSNEDVGGDDDEEAWLDALESGDVNERGYLPAKKAAALTTRQKALLGEDNGGLLELPLIKKEAVTEEDLLKKMEKNQKRKQAAQKRKEKRKAETVRKLIEKQATKKKEEDRPKIIRKMIGPHLHYITSSRELELSTEPVVGGAHSLLSLPSDTDYPIFQQQYTRPPPPTLCAIEGCSQVKRYSDAQTNLPLCSLRCYKKLRTSTQSIVTVTS